MDISKILSIVIQLFSYPIVILGVTVNFLIVLLFFALLGALFWFLGRLFE